MALPLANQNSTMPNMNAQTPPGIGNKSTSGVNAPDNNSGFGLQDLLKYGIFGGGGMLGGGLLGQLFGGNDQGEGNWWSGRPARTENVPLFTQQQQGVQNTALQKLLGMLQGPQNNYEGFDAIEQQYKNQFNQQTVPGLAERFNSLGDNKLSSGAFTQQLGQAGAGLNQGLAALKSQYGMQNRQQNQTELMNLMQAGLQQSFQPQYHKRQPGFAENTGNLLTQALPFLLALI